MAKVTVRTIAERLGVSPNAVSLALNEKPGVSERLRQEIIRTARELGYQGSVPDSVQPGCTLRYDTNHPFSRYAEYLGERLHGRSFSVELIGEAGLSRFRLELGVASERQTSADSVMLLFEKRSGYDAVLYETLTDVRDAPPPPQEVIVEEHLQHIDRFIRWRLDQPEASSRTIRFLPLADGSHGRWPEYLGAPAAKPDQRGVKRIALSDIAEAAGVAINTVSKALQGKPGVSEQNRLRLLTIANQLGYERIYTEKPMTLLVINEIQKHSYYLFNDFTERLRREARTQANRIEIVEITGNRTDNIENALSQINPDGLVLFFLSQTTLDWIQKHVTLPSVSVVSPAHGRMVDSVVEDHEAGMDRIVEHWYAQGYRKIGYVTHRPEDGKVSEIRYKAFRKSIESRGLPWAEDWAVTIPYTNVTEIEEYQLLSAELARMLNNSAAEHPEVIVCFNDQLAYNTQTVLSTIGRDNIKVSGWDRNPFMQNLLRFPTLETDLDALAFEAIQQLVRRMKHPLAPRCEVAVQSKLVVR